MKFSRLTGLNALLLCLLCLTPGHSQGSTESNRLRPSRSRRKIPLKPCRSRRSRSQPAKPAPAKRAQRHSNGRRQRPNRRKPAPADSNVIADIEFRGSRRVPQDTLRALIVTRKGDKYNEETLRRDFMALWNTGRFDDIRLENESRARPAGSFVSS